MKKKAFKNAISDIYKVSCFIYHYDDEVYPMYSPYRITTGKHMRFLWKTVMQMPNVKWDFCTQPKFVDARKYHLWMDEMPDGFHVGVCWCGRGKRR